MRRKRNEALRPRITARFAIAALSAALLAPVIGCGGSNGNDSPSAVPCGPKTCATGEVCCNQSCGICTPPGGACIQVFCGTP